MEYKCTKVINKYIQPMYEQILVYKNFFKKLPVGYIYDFIETHLLYSFR